MSSTQTRTLASLAKEDKAIEKQQDSSILALMKHRWTVVKKHGYSATEYAKALDRNSQGITKYVRAWEYWTENNCTVVSDNPNDVLTLAGMGQAKREAVEIVADARGVSVATVDHHAGYREDVRRVKADIEEGTEKLVKEKKMAPAAAKKKATAKVAQKAKRDQKIADNSRQKREAQKQNKTRAFRNLEYELLEMKKRGRNALQLARESNIEDPELIEILEDSIEQVRHAVELISMAILGESKIDWDAELAKLNK